MQRGGESRVTNGDGHGGPEGRGGEPATPRGFRLQGRYGVIHVGLNNNAIADRDIEVTQQVALAECGQEKELGVPAFGVPVEGFVGRCEDRRHTLGPDFGGARVVAVPTGSRTEVAPPLNANVILVVRSHTAPLTGRPEGE